MGEAFQKCNTLLQSLSAASAAAAVDAVVGEGLERDSSGQVSIILFPVPSPSDKPLVMTKHWHFSGAADSPRFIRIPVGVAI